MPIPEIVSPRGQGVRLFLDLNETLVHTGEVAPGVRLQETRELNRFVSLCERISASTARFHLIFLTGNSFEYSRRIEEPLGLKNISGMSLAIVSENGLIARSFERGDLWRLEPAGDYWAAVEKYMGAVARNEVLRSNYYTQGNEIRLTFKPVANTFTTQQIEAFRHMSRNELSPDVCLTYFHRYYVDIDPAYVMINGEKSGFGGKRFAAARLIQESEALNLAIGDSASDIPMFQTVLDSGGHAYWVGNADRSLALEGAKRLSGEYTAGVNQVLERIRIG